MTIGQRTALTLYSLAWMLALPLVVGYLLWRSRKQPEYREHWRERWSWWAADADAPMRRPVWIHAVSVGETRAAQPLIEALLARDPDQVVLLTHMTPTGRSLGHDLYVRRWPSQIRQQYLPYDHAWAMKRFLARWQPRLGIIMETELWPNLCAVADQARVPLVLANARLSARSLAKGRRWQVLIGPALASLDAVLAQSPADAERLRGLGRDDVEVLGNLKFEVAETPEMRSRGLGWREHFAPRRIVLIASSRDGEEALLLAAWRRLCPTGDQAPLLLIVPRHPQRFDEVAGLAQAQGWQVHRRSGSWPPVLAGSPAVLLGDSMGEMAAYYALADVAVIGGSLLPFGAQNLIEACAAAVPAIVGPHTYNFEQAATQAIEAGAACRVDDADAAIQRALSLLAADDERLAMGQAGKAFAAAHRGATGRTMAALSAWLD